MIYRLSNGMVAATGKWASPEELKELDTIRGRSCTVDELVAMIPLDEYLKVTSKTGSIEGDDPIRDWIKEGYERFCKNKYSQTP